MITIKTDEEIKLLRTGGKILANILKYVSEQVKPGISTFELNEIAEKMIYEQGGRPSFKNYGMPPYPSGLCTSVNSEIVHGIPKKDTILKNGDIISLDIGMEYPAKNGLYTDMAVTVPVGEIDQQTKNLIQTTKKALQIVADNLRPGIDLQEIAGKIQAFVEGQGFNVVRDMVGHGVGHAVHEEPQIPNYVIPNYHVKVEKGMVLAFEPMVTIGDYHIVTAKDNWTAITADNSLSAHFEHTFAVIDKGNLIITAL